MGFSIDSIVGNSGAESAASKLRDSLNMSPTDLSLSAAAKRFKSDHHWRVKYYIGVRFLFYCFRWAQLRSQAQDLFSSTLNNFEGHLSSVHCGVLSVLLLLGGPNITANLYCICSSENETYAYADAVQICGDIWNA